MPCRSENSPTSLCVSQPHQSFTHTASSCITEQIAHRSAARLCIRIMPQGIAEPCRSWNAACRQLGDAQGRKMSKSPGTTLDAGNAFGKCSCCNDTELRTLLKDQDVVVCRQVRDAQGRKMSKSLGNVVDPLDAIGEYGADALRYTLATGEAVERCSVKPVHAVILRERVSFQRGLLATRKHPAHGLCAAMRCCAEREPGVQGVCGRLDGGTAWA